MFFFLPLILLVTLITNESGSGDTSVMIGVFFSPPFEDSVVFTINSQYGYRTDPFTNYGEDFHTGIDLGAPVGTNIVASADGIVVGVGFQPEGLGNYVYIKHDFDGITYYTVYGHMADNSIVVVEGQKISEKEKIGVIGDTGKVTGLHLHFAILSPELKFDKANLIDPINAINGLKQKGGILIKEEKINKYAEDIAEEVSDVLSKNYNRIIDPTLVYEYINMMLDDKNLYEDVYKKVISILENEYGILFDVDKNVEI